MERARREKGNGEQAVSRCIAQCSSAPGSRQNEAVSGIDNSPFMVAQRRKLQNMFGSAAQLYVTGGAAAQNTVTPVQRVEEEEPLQGRFAVAQLQGTEEEEPLQGKFSTAQLQGTEEEEPLQGKFEAVQRVEEEEETAQPKLAPQTPAQLEPDSATRPNNTGLPDTLKSGVESLSGISMDNVRVHYNSSQPTQLNALAYAQGSDIHVAPGQELHLPHEAWHVVQQAQGRVQPTMQLREGVPVNDDAVLEHEADVMGEKASQTGFPCQMKTHNVVSSTSQVAQLVLTRSMWKIINETTISSDEEGLSVRGLLESRGYGKEIIEEILRRIVAKNTFKLSEDIFSGLVDTLGGYSEEYDDNDEVAMNVIDHGDLNEYDDPTQIDQIISDAGLPLQMARSGNTVTGPKDYTTKNFGNFTHVSYTTDGKGAIDFSIPTARHAWTNPVLGGSLVDLKNAGKPINTKNRSQHFAIGDYLLASKSGKPASNTTAFRKGKWTWHHMPTPYNMVLVDMTVHAKHGHNGGVYLW